MQKIIELTGNIFSKKFKKFYNVIFFPKTEKNKLFHQNTNLKLNLNLLEQEYRHSRRFKKKIYLEERFNIYLINKHMT